MNADMNIGIVSIPAGILVSEVKEISPSKLAWRNPVLPKFRS